MFKARLTAKNALRLRSGQAPDAEINGNKKTYTTSRIGNKSVVFVRV